MTDTYLKNDSVWVSLVGPFFKKYARIPKVNSDIEARIICANTPGLKHIWCSTYTEAEVDECIAKHGGEKITLADITEGWDAVYEERDAWAKERAALDSPNSNITGHGTG